MEADIQAVAVNAEGIPLWRRGSIEEPVWLHSAAKPFQLLPLLDRELDLKYGLTDEELVLLASSHLAQPRHVEVLLSLLQKTGLREDEMVLAPTHPHGRLAYRLWKERHGRERKRYHPCSGNHAAIMLLQRVLTGSTAGYERADSPAQQEILQYIRTYAEGEPILGIDNCGIPMYKLPLRKIAEAYQRLAAFPKSSAVQRFDKALHTAPLMIEGDGCIPTVLCLDRDLIAKTGIDHLLAVGMRKEKIGIAIHAKSGWEAVLCVLPQIFQEIGFDFQQLAPMLKEIECQLGSHQELDLLTK